MRHSGDQRACRPGDGKGARRCHHDDILDAVLYTLVSLLLIANTINIGANLGAMAAAVNLLIGGPTPLYVGVFAIVSVLFEVFIRYSRSYRSSNG